MNQHQMDAALIRYRDLPKEAIVLGTTRTIVFPYTLSYRSLRSQLTKRYRDVELLHEQLYRPLMELLHIQHHHQLLIYDSVKVRDQQLYRLLSHEIPVGGTMSEADHRILVDLHNNAGFRTAAQRRQFNNGHRPVQPLHAASPLRVPRPPHRGYNGAVASSDDEYDHGRNAVRPSAATRQTLEDLPPHAVVLGSCHNKASFMTGVYQNLRRTLKRKVYTIEELHNHVYPLLKEKIEAEMMASGQTVSNFDLEFYANEPRGDGVYEIVKLEGKEMDNRVLKDLLNSRELKLALCDPAGDASASDWKLAREAVQKRMGTLEREWKGPGYVVWTHTFKEYRSLEEPASKQSKPRTS